MLKLSIIIPCYNCHQTLRMAVESCYKQGFNDDEFEIILVDDHSTDDTLSLSKIIVSEKDNVFLFKHDINKGGGATRNTAVKHSRAEVIFCLDSDDLLPANTLLKMYTHLNNKSCDGVGVNFSKKFIGNDVKNIDIVHTFNRVNEKIKLDDLLQHEGLCSLYSTFMFTKEAFQKTGGYPTHHGFDTQGFAWRFLVANLYAETCPDTSYLHRIKFNPSYYIREYDNGRTNFNWLEIFKENFYIFNDEAQRFIKTFNCRDFTHDFFAELAAKKDVFAPEKNNYQSWEPYIQRKPVKRSSFLGLYYRVRHKTKNFIKRNAIIRKSVLDLLFTYEDVVARLKAPSTFFLLISYFSLRIKKLFRIGFNIKCYHNQDKIDIVIPTIGKDFAVLDLYIKHLRNNLCENINNIYLVSSDKETALKDYCQKENIIFIDEDTVLGYGKNSIQYTVNGVNRNGWLFQQLLKLSGDKFVQQQKYLIVDSDTILLNKHQFSLVGKTVLFESREYNLTYFSTFEKLFGYKPPHHLSLTSHMMLFDTKRLKEMKKEIEERHQKKWDQAYIENCDKSSPSGISDYETYAQWLIYNHPREVLFQPFYNISIKRALVLNKQIGLSEFKRSALSVSLHSYN